MDYRTYQQYLADGGWQAVSTHNEQIAHLTEQVNALRAEVDKLRADELIGTGFVGRSLAVVGFVAGQYGRARVWALAEGSTLTALDDGGTVNRRDGSDPWPGVCVAEAG